MRKSRTPWIAAVAVIAAAAGMGAGVLLSGGTATGSRGQAPASAATAMSGATGKVTEKSGDAVAIKTADGASHYVYYTSATRFSKVTSATAADVSVGTTVTAQGTTATDGVTATRVTIGGASLGGPPGR